jgi:hypothetical protein
MKKLTLLSIFFSCFSSFAQYNKKDANYIGISIGVHQFTLSSANFKATPQNGIQGGLSIRGNFYNDFDMVYGMQFFESKMSVQTKEVNTATTENVDFKLPGVQVFLTPSYKFIENHLSVELGPFIQLNDKFKIASEFEDNTLIDNPALTAKNITEVSKFNFGLLAGVTAGIKHFRVNVQYQMGLNNFLGGLNKQELDNKPDFKGRIGVLSGSLIVYF